MNILNLTSMINFENKSLLDKFKNEQILTISPFKEQNIPNSKNIKCEIASLTFVLAMILQKIVQTPYFQELDTAFLSGESSIGEEEIDEMYEFILNCKYVIVDDNFLNFYIDNENLISFLSIFSEKTGAIILNQNGKTINLEYKTPKELKDLQIYDGTVIYKHNMDDKFVGGPYFAMAAKIKDGDLVEIICKNKKFTKKFTLDAKQKGTIALFGLGKEKIDDFRFEAVKIIKVLQ